MRLDVGQEFVPAGHELVQAFGFQEGDDVVVGDAEVFEGVEDGVGFPVGAGDGVTGDHAVVKRGVQGLLRHGVDDAGSDELGDVQGVRVGRVLHSGGGPQRTLRTRAGFGQDRPASVEKSSS